MFRLTLLAATALAGAAHAQVPAIPRPPEPPAQTAAFRFEDVTETHLPDMTGKHTMDVEAADLDGDGDLDIVTAQEFLANIVLLNEGGRFRRADLLPALPADALEPGPQQLKFAGAGHDSEDVSIADFDGDGRLDIVIVSEDDVKFGRKDVHEFYRGTANGFVLELGRLPDSEANAVAHGDVDGDGDLDLLIAGAGQDRLLLNRGNGHFVDAGLSRLGSDNATAQDAEFADLDKDGDLDLILAQEGSHRLMTNDGRAVFTDNGFHPPSGNVEARKVAPADVDGDGDLDLYFSHVGWQGRSPNDMLMLNDGAGRFALATDERAPREEATTLDARFADLDGDGDLDMVRSDMGPISVWLNNGEGVLTDVSSQVFAEAVTGPNLAVEIADFDRDGRLDLYVGQRSGPAGQGQPARDRLLLGRAR